MYRNLYRYTIGLKLELDHANQGEAIRMRSRVPFLLFLLLVFSLSSNRVLAGDIHSRYAFDKNSNKRIQDLLDGSYEYVDIDGNDWRFRFRKVGDNIVGAFIAAGADICIQGKVNGNTITGTGLEESTGPSRQPIQPNPNLQGNQLVSLWDIPILRVARQEVFNLPLGTSTSRMYAPYWIYRSVLLDLRDFRAVALRNLQPPNDCKLRHPHTREVLN